MGSGGFSITYLRISSRSWALDGFERSAVAPVEMISN
jgi:hypothetical protein